MISQFRIHEKEDLRVCYSQVEQPVPQEKQPRHPKLVQLVEGTQPTWQVSDPGARSALSPAATNSTTSAWWNRSVIAKSDWNACGATT